MPDTPAARTEAAKADKTGKAGTNKRRNILFITTDQQRYDSLGCNGGTVARTPTASAGSIAPFSSPASPS